MKFGNKTLAVVFAITSAAMFANAQNIPSIIVQTSSQATAPGGTISFSVSASGAGTLAYQWAKNTTNLANGTFSGRATVSGATTSTLTLTTCTTNDQANYTCRITNTFGSVTSSIASLTVYVPPTITKQPIGQTNAVGSNITFTVVVAGSSPLSYQWQYNSSNIPSATLNVYTINNAGTNNSGNYTASASNPAGTVNSSAAKLLILNPPAITVQPTNATVILSNSYTFNVVATGDLLHYQWQKSGAPIIGATNSSYTITNADYSLNGSTFNVVVTNYFNKVNSSSVTLSVAGLPVIYSTLNQGLIAYYPFNGNANDASGNGNNLTLTSQTFIPDENGFPNSAIYFNYNTAVTIPNSQSWSLSNFTVALWVNLNSSGVKNGFWPQPTGQLNSDGNLVWEIAPASPNTITNNGWEGVIYQSTTPPSAMLVAPNQWVHLCMNLDGSYLRLYINGNLASVSSYAGSLPSPANLITIGGNGWVGPEQTWIGGIDQFRFYNRVLTPNEASEIYLTETGNNNYSMISGQPLSQVVSVGSNATFSVSTTAGVSPMFYQWFNTNGAIANQTNTSLTLTNVQLTNSGSSYFVVITNGYGSVTSSLAVLNVGYPPVIIQQPVSVTNIFGANAYFSCTVTGSSPIAVQWLQNGSALAGQTNATLCVSNVQSVMTGLQLSATNTFGVTVSADVSISFAIAPLNFNIVNTGSNDLHIQFQGTPGFDYAIQATTNLVSPINWQPIYTNATDTNGNWSFTDSNTIAYPARFYRAIIPQ